MTCRVEAKKKLEGSLPTQELASSTILMLVETPTYVCGYTSVEVSATSTYHIEAVLSVFVCAHLGRTLSYDTRQRIEY